MVEYQLFEHEKKGIILKRATVSHDKEKDLIVRFMNAPPGGMAIFETSDERTVYRRIKNCECCVPRSFLNGVISVTYVVFSGNTVKYQCENIYALDAGEKVVICPGGVNLETEVINLNLKIDILSKNYNELNGQLEKLNKKLEKILDGYDFD